MNKPEIYIPEEIAPEVFALASRYYAKQIQWYSVADLMQTATTILKIPPELIQQAIQEIQAQRPRNLPENYISEEIAPKVFALASQYYADQTKRYSVSDLVRAGEEVQIPPELVQQAIQEIQSRQKQAKQQRTSLLRLGVGGLAAVVLWSGWTYNSLSSADSNVNAAWAQVENQLQRRADLIPNLVSVTQAYAQQELASLLVESHQDYSQANTQKEKIQATATVNQAIDHFWNYAATNPELQSSQLLLNLQYELAGTENRLAVERRRYHQAVQDYNRKIQQFPDLLLAKAFGFEPISSSRR